MRPARDGLVEVIIMSVKRVCRGILNMRPVRDDMIEALTMNMNETFMRVYLICGLWKMIWLLEKLSGRAVALKKVWDF
jgi:hypothetical protein